MYLCWSELISGLLNDHMKSLR